MKQKTHSGLKKRIKIKKSGAISARKASRNHLLSNKSKRQKKSYKSGMPIDSTKVLIIRQLIPGAARPQKSGKKVTNRAKKQD